jgi:hypothetical protein
MHELIEDVLPFLVAFYVLDGLAVARAHEWLLLAPWGRFRAARTGIHLVGLSPFAEVASAFDGPIRFGRKALHVETGTSTPGGPPDLQPVPLDGLRVEASERDLKVGGLSLTLPSPAAARHLAAVIRDLRDRPPHERGARLRTLVDEAIDLKELRALRATQQQFQQVLQWLGLGLWLATFVLLPAGVLWKWQHGPGLAAALLTVGAFHVAILVVAWRTLRTLGYRRGSAFSALLSLVFFPPAAAHASVVLFRDLYARFDPLAVAGVLLPPTEFQAVARMEVHRLRREAELGGDVAEWTNLREKARTRLLSELGTSLADVLRPPSRKDDEAASYCPLCGGEYRAGFAVCAECQVPLEAMA